MLAARHRTTARSPDARSAVPLSPEWWWWRPPSDRAVGHARLVLADLVLKPAQRRPQRALRIQTIRLRGRHDREQECAQLVLRLDFDPANALELYEADLLGAAQELVREG